MKGSSIMIAIRGAIHDSDNAKLYLAHIGEQFQGSFKAHAITLITKIATLKYSESTGVREHILWMNDTASQLKSLDMEISEGVEIHRDRSRGILELSQRAYIDKVLKRFNMHNCAPVVAPVVKARKVYVIGNTSTDMQTEESLLEMEVDKQGDDDHHLVASLEEEKAEEKERV
ncbi:hypothetical protein RJ639_012815 [Escallonia herrerae]|uniref:Uncharacterized protein n=1 Tax=Escallonia herrerae TaxID=1293975 RepID=A0AA88VJF7_9ASTE|nr:hypothetical protein RJ639_012815 [Escallonia herrerae]